MGNLRRIGRFLLGLALIVILEFVLLVIEYLPHSWCAVKDWFSEVWGEVKELWELSGERE